MYLNFVWLRILSLMFHFILLGTHSYYTNWKDIEIMFHVGPLLPTNPADKQNLERKRHGGNDVIIIVFKTGKTPFDPTMMRSTFNRKLFILIIFIYVFFFF
jgi:hypothetical protein